MAYETPPDSINPRMVCRCATEERARELALTNSKLLPTEDFHVIESHRPVYGSSGDPHPYTVDMNGFIRDWELLIAVYRNGAELKE